MTAFFGGPAWPDLDALMAKRDLQGAVRLAEQTAEVDTAERQLVIGACQLMFQQAEPAEQSLLKAFHGFGTGRPARAAEAAVVMGRLHYFVRDSPSVANGWFARARRLVAEHPHCVEHAHANLPLPGCDIPDVTVLAENASSAVALARRLGDCELEAKALADLGTAKVSLAQVEEGMTVLDEAMAMVRSGEATSPFAAADVVCNLLTSCARIGDIGRAEEWIRAGEKSLGLDVNGAAPFLFAHCRLAYGLILCDAGRWDAAEVTFQLASTRAQLGGRRIEGMRRAALSQLWLLQGRLADAERLLSDRRDHMDTLLPLAALHLARGNHAEAIAAARRGLQMIGGDRLRAARLLGICVEAELARGEVEAGRSAAARLGALAADHPVPVLSARVAIADGLVAEATGDREAALHAYEAGLRALAGADWPLLRAELHHGLGRVLAATDRAGALAEVRDAHLTYERIGSPSAVKTAALLTSLGIPARVRPRPADATAALSRREREVLELLRDGLTNAEIAARLHNSVRTIEHHVSSILGKLALRSRAEAAVYAATLETKRDPRAG